MIVSKKQLTAKAEENGRCEVIKYLDRIRNKFDLPISYRHFKLETNELSEDY